MIEFKNVSKTFSSNGQDVHALQNIQLTIEKGDIYGVIGFSGAGKSTLIRTVNLIERPTAGEIIVNNENLVSYSLERYSVLSEILDDLSTF